MTRAEQARALVVPAALGVVLGGLGGWLWWLWWGPAPTGKIYDTDAGPHWYPDPFDPGITRDFSGTAEYVVIGFVLALVIGAVTGWLTRDRAVPGLVAVAVSCIIGAALMTFVGTAQSPADPQARATEVKVGTKLPGHLSLAQADIDLPDALADAVHDDDGALQVTTPWLVWPLGGLLGFMVVLLSLATPRAATDGSPRPEQPSAAPAPSD